MTFYQKFKKGTIPPPPIEIEGFHRLGIYMIISIVDEDEKYETYLLQIKGKTYLLVKEREHRD